MSLNIDEKPVIGCLALPFILVVIFAIGLCEFVVDELILGGYRLEDEDDPR